MSGGDPRSASAGPSAGTGGDDVLALGVAELRAAYESRELSPVELLDSAAARIEATEPTLNAFTTLSLDRAAEEAEAAIERYATGEARPLEGIPVAVKDLFETEGLRTTYGSSIYADHVPDADAEAVRLVRAAGGIVIGKTSTHEFAWGITSENPHYGPCRNPWDPNRVSGGSSGGSAVAVAIGAAPLALGTDTGGSIRIPSAFCGVVGLKPTYGRISTAGVIPLAQSLDHVGPMARTPQDAALLYDVLRGAETAAGAGAEPLSGGGNRGLDGVRVGLSPELNGIEPAPAVARVLDDAAATFESIGATLVEVPFSRGGEIGPAFAVIQRVEAVVEHGRRGIFPARAAEYGEDVRGRMSEALELDLADYVEAVRARSAITGELAGLFSSCDLVLTPVAAGEPALVGEPYVHLGEDVDFRLVAMSTTMGQNLAGLPACVFRAGFDPDGLPVGVQLTAAHGAEARLLAAASAIVGSTPEIQSQAPELLGSG